MPSCLSKDFCSAVGSPALSIRFRKAPSKCVFRGGDLVGYLALPGAGSEEIGAGVGAGELRALEIRAELLGGAVKLANQFPGGVHAFVHV